MKTIYIIALLISTTAIAQIKGNKNIETRSFPFQNVQTIDIQMYAQVIIDNSILEGLEITAESNLFEYINKEVVNGKITFDQKKWIEPTANIIIKIGAPNLKKVIQGTHDTTQIINLDNDLLAVNASIGKVIITGKTNELRLDSKRGRIDARNVTAKNVFINLWDSGRVLCNPTEYLNAKVNNDGRLLYKSLPNKNDIKTETGGKAMLISDYKTKNKKLEYISFKIKNNSANRNHFVVKGPNSTGGTFGYGFPLMPFAKRAEKWPVGTKIYQENKLGLKKLLVTIKAEDAGRIVKLFE